MIHCSAWMISMFWIHSRHWFIPAAKPQAWPGDRKLDRSGRIWRGVLQHVVIPFWDLCFDVERTINFFIIFADIEQVCFEDLLFFRVLAAYYRCRTCLPLAVSLRIIQLRVMTRRATWTSRRRSCLSPKIRFLHCTPDDWNNIYIWNKSRSLTSKNGIPKVSKTDLFAKTCSTSLHVLLLLQMQTHRRTQYLPQKLLRLRWRMWVVGWLEILLRDGGSLGFLRKCVLWIILVATCNTLWSRWNLPRGLQYNKTVRYLRQTKIDLELEIGLF